jgi:hypothetical protein
MTGITWFDVAAACVVGVGWRVRAGLRRLAEARTVEAERRAAYRLCAQQERAAEFAADTLAHDEKEMARLVEWFRTTEGTGDAGPEGT